MSKDQRISIYILSGSSNVLNCQKSKKRTKMCGWNNREIIFFFSFYVLNINIEISNLLLFATVLKLKKENNQIKINNYFINIIDNDSSMD